LNRLAAGWKMTAAQENVDMLTTDAHITDWLQLIRAEYLEMPGLRLTESQVQRLWGLDPATSQALLAALLDVKFLKRTRHGAYMRTDVS